MSDTKKIFMMLILAYLIMLSLATFANGSNIDLATKSFEALVTGSEKLASQYLSPDVIVKELGAIRQLKGRQAALNIFSEYKKAYPDIKIKQRQVLDGGPIVLIQATMNGTHKRAFRGSKPTEKKVGAEMCYLAWIYDNEVKRITAYLAADILIEQIQSKDKIKVPGLPADVVQQKGKSLVLRNKTISQLYGVTGYAIAARLAGLQGKTELSQNVYSEFKFEKIIQKNSKVKKYTKPFPDMKINLDQIYSSGDYVIAKMLAKGTHKAPIKDIKQTNRKVSVEVIVVAKVNNSEIEMVQVYMDGAKLIQQLR